MFFSVLLLSVFLFAENAKWKANDLFNEKKLNKLIETYNLTLTYDNVVKLYTNEETSDYIYISREGNEEKFDSYVCIVIFAYLDGHFDSCTKYGVFIGHDKTDKYLYACLTEYNTLVQQDDYTGKTTWYWKDPEQLFSYMFKQRDGRFNNLLSLTEKIELEIPDEIYDRYDYFDRWIIKNRSDKDFKKKLIKEYKKYLKEHKS